MTWARRQAASDADTTEMSADTRSPSDVAMSASAFVERVRAHDPALRRLVRRMLAGRDGIDDVMQDVYLSAYRSLDRFRGDAELSTWLYRVAYNRCVDELRRSARRERTLLQLNTVVADPARMASLRQAVEHALAALPVEQRAAVALVDGEDLEYSRAAEVLGVPRGTVASRVARGRAALRAALDDWRTDA